MGGRVREARKPPGMYFVKPTCAGRTSPARPIAAFTKRCDRLADGRAFGTGAGMGGTMGCYRCELGARTIPLHCLAARVRSSSTPPVRSAGNWIRPPEPWSISFGRFLGLWWRGRGLGGIFGGICVSLEAPQPTHASRGPPSPQGGGRGRSRCLYDLGRRSLRAISRWVGVRDPRASLEGAVGIRLLGHNIGDHRLEAALQRIGIAA
jgi:hypothetical protein